MLITLSGIDGSGKSTLAVNLESELTRRGKSVIQMEFPYSKNWLLLQLLSKKGAYFDKYGTDNSYIGYMINFERLSFFKDYVLPNLECYDYVILQRFFVDFAAIGIAQKANSRELFLLKDMYNLFKFESAQFCIDISHEIAYERLCNRGISSDLREQKDFHNELAMAYKQCIERNDFDSFILDGKKKPNELVNEIIKVIL